MTRDKTFDKSGHYKDRNCTYYNFLLKKKPETPKKNFEISTDLPPDMTSILILRHDKLILDLLLQLSHMRYDPDHL